METTYEQKWKSSKALEYDEKEGRIPIILLMVPMCRIIVWTGLKRARLLLGASTPESEIYYACRSFRDHMELELWRAL